jgi:VanZ family protein
LAETNSGVDWRGRFIRFAPVVLWAGVIFFLSSPQGSMAQTSRLIGPILHFLFPEASDQLLQIYHQYIRKTAHFTEYAILAYLSARALTQSSRPFLQRFRLLLPLVLVALVASIDEFNQSFEPSRTGSFLDVLLDLSGGCFTIAALWIFSLRTRAKAGTADTEQNP